MKHDLKNGACPYFSPILAYIQFWCLVISNTPNIKGGTWFGSKYTLDSACKLCGTGASRVGPLYVNVSKCVKKEVFITMHFDILISIELADELALIGIDCFDEVYSRSGNVKLPVKVLNAEGTLPKFLTSSSGYAISRQCTQCKRDGHFGLQDEEYDLKYKHLPEELMRKNVLWTYERFGLSRLRTPFTDSAIAKPLTIVSTKFKEVVERHIPKITGVEFYPVYVD